MSCAHCLRPAGPRLSSHRGPCFRRWCSSASVTMCTFAPESTSAVSELASAILSKVTITPTFAQLWENSSSWHDGEQTCTQQPSTQMLKVTGVRLRFCTSKKTLKKGPGGLEHIGVRCLAIHTTLDQRKASFGRTSGYEKQYRRSESKQALSSGSPQQKVFRNKNSHAAILQTFMVAKPVP